MSNLSWRICLVTDVYPPECGGSGWSTHALARMLLKRGHQTDVISLDPTTDNITHRSFEGIEVTDVGIQGSRRNPIRRLGAHDYSYITLFNYLEQYLTRESDVDVLHAQHMHSGVPVVDIGRVHKIPTVLTLRDYWPVCLHGTSWWGQSNCEGCTTQYLTECMKEYWNFPHPLARMMVPWSRRRLASRQKSVREAGRVITVSDAVRVRIAREQPDTKFSVLPNIVDLDLLRSAVTEFRHPKIVAPYLLTAGKLIPTKGFDLLFDALAYTKTDLPLVVAGDGPMKNHLESRARQLGLSVTFCGWLPHGKLLRLQQEAYSVIVPSAWNEPLSRIILESMGLGVPVIAWAGGGTEEIIDSGVNGYIVKSSSDLDRILLSLKSSSIRIKVGQAAQEWVGSKCSPEIIYPLLKNIYSDVRASCSPQSSGI